MGCKYRRGGERLPSHVILLNVAAPPRCSPRRHRFSSRAPAHQPFTELFRRRRHQSNVLFDLFIAEPALEAGKKQCSDKFAIGAEDRRPDADDIGITLAARDAVAVAADLVVACARRSGESHQHVTARTGIERQPVTFLDHMTGRAGRVPAVQTYPRVADAYIE